MKKKFPASFLGRLISRKITWFLFCYLLLIFNISSLYAFDFGIIKIWGNILKAVSMVKQQFKTDTPRYCSYNSSLSNTIYSQVANQRSEDSEGIFSLIDKYAPIVYLHSEEIYLPMTNEEYLLNKHTRLMCKPKSNGEAFTVLSREDVSMDALYNFKGNEKCNYYFEIDDCIRFGSNPVYNRKRNGTLATPAYVKSFEDPKYPHSIYLSFAFFYGFHGANDIHEPLTGQCKLVLKGDSLSIQGAHEGDLKHIVMEIDKKSKKIKRILYDRHGTGEGNWLAANHPAVEYEGTRPILYAAKDSHGLYPKTGTYVRLYGFGNDFTNRGIRWEPRWIRVYDKDDSRFNPAIMGWIYNPGDYGKRGVGSLGSRDWFIRLDDSEPLKRYEDLIYSPDPKHCATIKERMRAKLPPGTNVGLGDIFKN